MKYYVAYGSWDEKEHFFKERNRECVSKTTYYRRKKVWKNPPIGVKIEEINSIGAKYFFVNFGD